MLINTSILLALTVGAFFVMVWVIRAARRSRPRRDPPPIVGFSMADLHQLHESGQLSVEEFERAKASLIARTPQDAPQPRGHGFQVLPVKPED